MMSEIVGVRFQRAGKIYYFDAGEIPVEVNDHVVVETSRGQELGRVVISPGQVLFTAITEPLKRLVRKAETEDIQQAERQREKEQKALANCQESIRNLSLPMRPIYAQYSLDGSHLTVFFTAEKRVDFRELVKELSRRLKTHVELRQVGPRDEAKLTGGLGRCGLPLCCSTFLCEFAPVSIKMAKEQDMALNPVKTSGICGRLLCCLGYEYDQYRAAKEKLPQPGQQVSTSLGDAKVVGISPLKQTVSLELRSGVTMELPVDQITWRTKPPGGKQWRNK